MVEPWEPIPTQDGCLYKLLANELTDEDVQFIYSTSSKLKENSYNRRHCLDIPDFLHMHLHTKAYSCALSMLNPLSHNTAFRHIENI